MASVPAMRSYKVDTIICQNLTLKCTFTIPDIEVQLELAENRCNSLKGQLDLMKNLYEPNTKGTKIRKFSNAQKSQVIKGILL